MRCAGHPGCPQPGLLPPALPGTTGQVFYTVRWGDINQICQFLLLKILKIKLCIDICYEGLGKAIRELYAPFMLRATNLSTTTEKDILLPILGNDTHMTALSP